ncbi:hypothetical protein MOQ_002412 [Trypanosoma cruzi marinkellei]|uniref:Uncharacterized protein n=1 Tax=Trypanosoma cruzi marinkellei TaxID=85056 RepID=K2MEW7_TRYCR|nr:hypothetical protein MOQ_002412 [Trypanosoma cruzi marinkellei]
MSQGASLSGGGVSVGSCIGFGILFSFFFCCGGKRNRMRFMAQQNKKGGLWIIVYSRCFNEASVDQSICTYCVLVFFSGFSLNDKFDVSSNFFIFIFYNPTHVEFFSVKPMSIDSSDVYVMEDAEESLCTGSANSPLEDLVRSSSFTSLESSNEKCGRHPKQQPPPLPAAKATARTICTVGTNTEKQVEESVSNLLRSGIMGLMHTIAGDEFAHYMLHKSRQDIQQSYIERITKLTQNTVDVLHKLIPRQSYPTHGTESASEVAMMDNKNEPEWLSELQLSLAKTDALLQGLTEKQETVLTATDAAEATCLLPTVPAARSNVRFSASQQISSVPSPLQDKTGRMQELEEELRMLQEQMAELRVVFAKEGVDSVVPLYTELLSLRAAKRQAALREVENTMAYLVTQQCCFDQQLEVLERRKKSLEVEASRRFYEGGDAVNGLMEDVEKLAQAGRKLNALRDEYRQRVREVDPMLYTNFSSFPGEKRQRTSHTNFSVLFDRQSEKDQEIMALRGELNTQRQEMEEWKRRYEAAVEEMSRPQESPVFNSLLRAVEERISQEAAQRCTLLCRLFGWELLQLTDDTVALARVGCAEERLTLPMPNPLGDETSAMARSIVLAKKVLEGSLVSRGECQKHEDAEEEQNDDAGDQAPTQKDNEEEEAEETVLTKEGTPFSTNDDHAFDTGVDDAAETGEMDTEAPSEENPLVAENTLDSPGKLEPSFYSSGLWEE